MRNGELVTVVTKADLAAGLTAEVRGIYGTSALLFYVHAPVYTVGPYYELHEGVTWLKGHHAADSPEGLALLAACALAGI